MMKYIYFMARYIIRSTYVLLDPRWRKSPITSL